MRILSFIAIIAGLYFQSKEKDVFFENTLQPTVQIINKSKNGSGTAVIVKSTKIKDDLYMNFAFSCEHVVSPKMTVQAFKYSKKKFCTESFRSPAALVTSSQEDDISIISFYSKDRQPCCKTKYDYNLNLLDEVCAVGCGLSESPRYAEGKITGISDKNNFLDTLRTTIPIVPGDSGGGLYNKNYELIGIANSIRKLEMNGMSYPVEGISLFKSIDLMKSKFDNIKHKFVFGQDSPPKIFSSYLWLLDSEFSR